MIRNSGSAGFMQENEDDPTGPVRDGATGRINGAIAMRPLMCALPSKDAFSLPCFYT